MDLDSIMNELEEIRSRFPTLKDLKEEEQLMKATLADSVADRRYDAANDLKRDLLTLKKKITKERRSLLDQAEYANIKSNQIQAQVESMIEGSDDSFELDDLDRKVSFVVDWKNDIDSLPVVAGNQFGKSRCGSGNSVMLGPTLDYQRKKLPAPFVTILSR